MTDPQTIIAAGEASAARLPADRPAVYAEWAQPGAELQEWWQAKQARDFTGHIVSALGVALVAVNTMMGDE